MTNIFIILYNHQDKASYLSKYFQRENPLAVLSFLIRQQVTKGTEEIALLSISHSPSR